MGVVHFPLVVSQDCLITTNQLSVRGFVGSLDGKVILRDEVTKVFDDSSNLSYQLYKKLIEAGAMELLEETNDN